MSLATRANEHSVRKPILSDGTGDCIFVAVRMTEEEMAQRVAEAAEHGCPNDRHGQIRLIAGYQAGLGIGVTLRALQIILDERPDGTRPPGGGDIEYAMDW